MNDVAVHFVHDFLLIRSRSELELYMGYKPGDFLRKLGYRLYKDKLDLLIELTIIWSVTARVESSVPYSTYLVYREKFIGFYRHQYSMILQTPPPYQKDSLLFSSIKKTRVSSPEPHSTRSRKTYHSSPLL